MDSLATLELPAVGYGIRYDYGIFEQRIEHGQQVEHRDNWLQYGNPWELPRHEHAQVVRLYGTHRDAAGRRRTSERALGRYQAGDRRALRLVHRRSRDRQREHAASVVRACFARFRPHPVQRGRLSARRRGESRRREHLQGALPADHTDEGKELRLKQQYFFVACSLADIVRHFKLQHKDFRAFPTSPRSSSTTRIRRSPWPSSCASWWTNSGLEWDEAWRITQATLAYTNHTLLPEALEKWPVPMFERVLPRHLMIIYEINQRFMRAGADALALGHGRMSRMSIIEEGTPKQVRMAHLATVGSHSINGVAQLHSDLVKSELLHDFYELFPERFNNKTNGVTPRRWLLYANPKLTSLITSKLGPEVVAGDLSGLELPARARGRRRAARCALAGEAAEQAGAGQADRRALRRAGRSGVDVRDPGQAHPRVQASAARVPADHRPLPQAQARSRAWTRCREPTSSRARPRLAT